MSNSPSIPQAILDEVISGMHIANGIRYISCIGLTLLVYDHSLTFSDEIKYVWRAPKSWAKYIFLVNRYIAAACLLAAAHEMCGFNGARYSKAGCQALLGTLSLVSVFSTSSANLLIYIRVLLLWDKQPVLTVYYSLQLFADFGPRSHKRVLLFLGIFFIISSLATTGCMIASVSVLISSVERSDLAHICMLTMSSRIFVFVWAAPMGFELTVLGMMTYNALSRPRTGSAALRSTLYRDGTVFFFCITCFRMTNIAFAASADPSRMTYPMLFTWAMTTLVVNRLVIHIRSSEAKIDHDDTSSPEDEDDGAVYMESLPTPGVGTTHSPALIVRVESVTHMEGTGGTQESMEMRTFKST